MDENGDDVIRPWRIVFVVGQVGVHRKVHTGNSISSITRLVMRSLERNELIAVFNILLMALSHGVLSSFWRLQATKVKTCDVLFDHSPYINFSDSAKINIASENFYFW